MIDELRRTLKSIDKDLITAFGIHHGRVQQLRPDQDQTKVIKQPGPAEPVIDNLVNNHAHFATKYGVRQVTVQKLVTYPLRKATPGEETVRLLGKRNDTAEDIGKIKKRNDIPIEVEEKEEGVIEHWRKSFEKHGHPRETGEKIAQYILEESKWVQRNYS